MKKNTILLGICLSFIALYNYSCSNEPKGNNASTNLKTRADSINLANQLIEKYMDDSTLNILGLADDPDDTEFGIPITAEKANSEMTQYINLSKDRTKAYTADLTRRREETTKFGKFNESSKYNAFVFSRKRIINFLRRGLKFGKPIAKHLMICMAANTDQEKEGEFSVLIAGVNRVKDNDPNKITFETLAIDYPAVQYPPKWQISDFPVQKGKTLFFSAKK